MQINRLINLSFAHTIKEHLKGIRVTTHIHRQLPIPVSNHARRKILKTESYTVLQENNSDNFYLNDNHEDITVIVIHCAPKIMICLHALDYKITLERINTDAHCETHYLTFFRLRGEISPIGNKSWKWYTRSRMSISSKNARHKHNDFYTVTLSITDHDMQNSARIIAKLLPRLQTAKFGSIAFNEGLIVKLTSTDLTELRDPSVKVLSCQSKSPYHCR